MKQVLLFLILSALSYGVFAQKPKPTPPKKPAAVKTAVPKPTPIDPAVEKAQLDAALAMTEPGEKASALKKFLVDFPNSDSKLRAGESLVVARAALGDEKLLANDADAGVALFKLAAEEAPTPISERLFNEIISKFPANLYWRGQRAAGLAVAAMIEGKSKGNASQLLTLAAFYLSIENGDDAKRLADAALLIDPASGTAYQTLGLAARLNFDLEASATAYAKALELQPDSAIAKRSLAEMKRALGKADESAALYSELLAKDENDRTSETGLILSLFDSGKKAEAEKEMARSLEKTPENLTLLAGAGYWYAAHGEGDKAVDYAKKAVDLEPRFIWGHIALARGLMVQQKPVEAENVLIAARKYGNFPTLDYEIASARFAAGFYREAIEELQKSFTFQNGTVQTKLGGRIARDDKTPAGLIAYERRSSIFEPAAADDVENAARLLTLMELTQKLAAAAPSEAEASALTDEFVKGDDKMKIHRQLYAALLLLQKKAAPAKALELSKAAIDNADAGLEVAAPGAAVMANELYDSRSIAFSRGEFVIIPEVPRQTLSSILRGRIEEMTGWSLYQQEKYPEAIVRLRRAISVMPDKSAWWRSSVWRLGAALEANGAEKEALDSYIQSYKTDKPDAGKYIVIESLYKKLNGSSEGLEGKIGANPLQGFARQTPEVPAEIAEKPPVPVIEKTTESAKPPETVPVPEIKPVETVKTEPSPEVSPQPSPVTDVEETKPVVAKETLPEEKKDLPVEIKETEAKAIVPEETKPAEKTKDLFDPIIITVPKNSIDKPKEKPVSDPAETKGETTDEKSAKTEDETDKTPVGDRPRVIAGQEITAACSISISQENVSLLNNGGSVGILVGAEGNGDVSDLTAVSNSPKDIEVKLEPEIGGVSVKRFYIIKSISTAAGIYQVKFEGKCGTKEILIRVR